MGLLLARVSVLAFGRMQCAPTRAGCAGVGDLVGVAVCVAVGVGRDVCICVCVGVGYSAALMPEDALFSGVLRHLLMSLLARVFMMAMMVMAVATALVMTVLI